MLNETTPLTRVLLCDDEPHILRAAQYKLQKAGLAVALASDGEQAWNLLLQELPEIVVTDYQMPKLNGLDLARRMYTHPQMQDIPIILLTAKGLELAHEQCFSGTNIFTFMTKPFSPRRLVEVVAERLSLKLIQA